MYTHTLCSHINPFPDYHLWFENLLERKRFKDRKNMYKSVLVPHSRFTKRVLKAIKLPNVQDLPTKIHVLTWMVCDKQP